MNPFQLRARSWLIPFFAPLVILCVMILARSTQVGEQVEGLSEDWRFRYRADSDPPSDDRILIAGISDYSLAKVGRWEDWNRNIHAKICELLALQPPKTLAYDLFFSEHSGNPDHDYAFADALTLHPGAITGAVANLDQDFKEKDYAAPSIGKTMPFKKISGAKSQLLTGKNGNLPIEDIGISAWTGFVNAPPSGIDGMKRSIPLLVKFGSEIYPSFALQILMQFEEVSPDDVEIVLGKNITISKQGEIIRQIPIDIRGFMRINYRKTANFEKWDYIKIGELLESYQNTQQWEDSSPQLKGKMVLVGQMAEGLTDFGPTPFRPLEANVFVHANALNTILSNDYIKQVGKPVTLVIWLLIAWATMFMLHQAKTSKALLIPIAIIVLYISACFLLFYFYSILLPLVLPTVGFFLIHATTISHRLVTEANSRRQIKNIMGAYVSPELVQKILDSGEEPQLGGEKSVITVFFSDIASFSSFSEVLSPEELVDLMITYLTEMSDVLMNNGGLLDKYIGDAIVGMFGALIPMDDHAYQGVSTAIALQKSQNILRERWREEGKWPEAICHMQTRIGLNTGEAVVGNMGSSRRFNYTMMGDSVNLAARCESGAKSYGVYIMITGETWKAAKAEKDDIVYRYLDRIVVKGRATPVDVYEVVGFKSDVPANVTECLRIYQSGMDAYLKQDFDEAIEQFQKSSRIESWQPEVHQGAKTNPSLVMLERSRELRELPAQPNWDGVYEMTTK